MFCLFSLIEGTECLASTAIFGESGYKGTACIEDSFFTTDLVVDALAFGGGAFVAVTHDGGCRVVVGEGKPGRQFW